MAVLGGTTGEVSRHNNTPVMLVQLSCSAYFGHVADDPNFPIPIYHDLLEIKGADIWHPDAEIFSARK